MTSLSQKCREFSSKIRSFLWPSSRQLQAVVSAGPAAVAVSIIALACAVSSCLVPWRELHVETVDDRIFFVQNGGYCLVSSGDFPCFNCDNYRKCLAVMGSCDDPTAQWQISSDNYPENNNIFDGYLNLDCNSCDLSRAINIIDQPGWGDGFSLVDGQLIPDTCEGSNVCLSPGYNGDQANSCDGHSQAGQVQLAQCEDFGTNGWTQVPVATTRWIYPRLSTGNPAICIFGSCVDSLASPTPLAAIIFLALAICALGIALSSTALDEKYLCRQKRHEFFRVFSTISGVTFVIAGTLEITAITEINLSLESAITTMHTSLNRMGFTVQEVPLLAGTCLLYTSGILSALSGGAMIVQSLIILPESDNDAEESPHLSNLVQDWVLYEQARDDPT